MSPAENKRAKKRKNKKGRTSMSNLSAFPPSNEMASLPVLENKLSEACEALTPPPPPPPPIDSRNSNKPSERRICIKCHRPQVTSDLKKTSTKLGEFSAGLLEGFRVSRDLHLCEEKKVELGIPDPLWLCEDCENFLLLSENKAMYNSYRLHDFQSNSILNVDGDLIKDGAELDETEMLNSGFEAANESVSDIVSLIGAPSINLTGPSNGGTCFCAACCERKQVENEEEEECRELKRGWLDIKSYLHRVYREEGLYLSDSHGNISGGGAVVGESSLIDYLTQSLSKKKKCQQGPTMEALKEWVHRLCKQDPQHLFLCLESQVKLFISEMRIRLLSLLKHLPCKLFSSSEEIDGESNGEQDEEEVDSQGNSNLAMALKACLQSKFPNNYDGDIFLLWVFHEYQTLCTASRRLAPILEELEATHLKNFNLTWELVNRHLFRSIVYSDPAILLNIQRCCLNCSCALHINIEQKFSKKTSSHVWSNKNRNSKCAQHNGNTASHGGVECPTLLRFAKLDDEMTVINVVYREALVLIEEFNKRQMVQAKQRFKDWESFHEQWKMMEQEVLNKKNAFAKAFYQKSLLQCQNSHSQINHSLNHPSSAIHCPIVDTNLSSPNNLNLTNTMGGGSKNCKNLGILNLNEEALVKLAMSSNCQINLSGSSSNCSSSPSSSCSSTSESSVLSSGAVVDIHQGEDLKLLLQEINKLNSNEILPKQVTDLLINSAGFVSQSSSSSIPLSVPSNAPTNSFSSNIKCDSSLAMSGCLHTHRGDVSPSLFSIQPKIPRSDISNSYRRNLYNPVKNKTLLPLHNPQSSESTLDGNSSCECHDCLIQKNPPFNLSPMAENSSSHSTPSEPPPFSVAASTAGTFSLLPHHLSDIARNAASHLASKALIPPHLYNLHARKSSNVSPTSLLETHKRTAADSGSPSIPGVAQQSSGNNSIDFELVAKEVFREQVKLAAQGEWSLDIVKSKVAAAVIGNLGISNNAQPSAAGGSAPLGTLSVSTASVCSQSKTFFPPLQRKNSKGSTTPRSRSGSSGDLPNGPSLGLPATSHNVGTQSDALPPGGSPLKNTQGINCVMGANIPIDGNSQNSGNIPTDLLRVNGNVSKCNSQDVAESVTKGTSTLANAITQRDQIVMTEGTASVAVGTTAAPSECQMRHHHHHHSRDQCCESAAPSSGAGSFVEGDESGLDDSCSERSSSTSTSNPRESRVCDCCYCEVFGHGVPVVAPVSRNYPEMRERLRLRLSKRKAEGSTGTSKMAQQLSVSSSISTSNQLEHLPITDKNSGKISTSSADDRELDALLRYINGTDLDQETEASNLQHDHQHGCSGNCRKATNGTQSSTSKNATKKQRKKAKKANADEKKVSLSPPICENNHESLGNPQETTGRDMKKVRSVSPLDNRINFDSNIASTKMFVKNNRLSGNLKVSQAHNTENLVSSSRKVSTNKALPKEDISGNNSKSKNKPVLQSRSKLGNASHSSSSANQAAAKENTPTKSLTSVISVSKENAPMIEPVLSGPKKNPLCVNGVIPASVLNSSMQMAKNLPQSNITPAPARSKKSKKKKHCLEDSSSLDEVFLPKDIDLENGELDEAEKELEAFKRFCMASVPLANKEKVHVNVKDIIIKKKVNNANGNMATAT